MKILHTSDWHIGKKLHRHDLQQDMNLFIEWLVNLIEERGIDILLISGDIFDLANPSSEARKQYYRSLLQLHKTHCKVIITGGNHDSANMLNAPKELMKELQIHVVGGLTEDIQQHCIPIYKDDHLECVIAAIPFLKDIDFRRANEGENYQDRLEIVQKGIENTYQKTLHFIKENYPKNVPIVAMGHLYTSGAITSDSERDIQIGNQARFHAQRFGDDFAYVALGHIHKPQRITANIPIYYSGSPLPLSFSERNDTKRVLLIDTEKGFDPESIAIPCFRKLIRISGDFNTIELQLKNLEMPKTLTSLIEIELKEENYNAELIPQLEKLIQEFDREGYEIIHRTIHFKNQLQGTGELYNPSQSNLSELNPKDVFDKLINTQQYDETTEKELTQAFQILLEEELSEV